MTEVDWQQLKVVLGELMKFPESEQAAVLDETCREAPALRAAAERLLTQRSRLSGFIDRPLWTPHDETTQDTEQGQRIGPYRIRRLLGRGGMGAVYLAVREEDFDHQVAIKLVDPGLGQNKLWRRLYAERQILAELHHPNIARLLDGGTTEDNRPYLVMEYVEGEQIDRYCDDARLSVRQRIDLFLEVCAAVQAAHRALVVHRDLKPSNILVDADGTPTLLDFGIAKLLDPSHIAAGLTREGASPMTPNYASPEQVRGLPITTASDVYALGMLLYKLLTGRRPYELKGLGYFTLAKVVCEHEPLRPSLMVEATADEDSAAALLTASRRRTTTVARLKRQLAGDVDAIVLKALRKEPEQRYGSVELLADDLQRYLDGRSVRARRGTWVYHTGKLLRRHTALVVLAALVLASSVVSTILWRQAVERSAQAEAARDQAISERARAEEVTALLTNLFRGADPDVSRGAELTVREALAHGRAQLAELADQPDLQAEMFRTLGEVYRSLGEYADALTLLEDAVSVRRRHRSEPHEELARELDNLGGVYYYLRDYPRAEALFEEALVMGRELDWPAEDLVTTMLNLASVHSRQGDGSGAEQLYLESLALGRFALSPEHEHIASGLHGLGTLYFERGDLERAEPLLRQALAQRIDAHGRVYSTVASVLGALGRTLHARGKLAEAGTILHDSLEVNGQLFGMQSRKMALAQRDLAALLIDVDDTKGAEALIAQALERLQQAHPAGHWTVDETAALRGLILTDAGRYDEAEPLLLSGYQASRQGRGRAALQTRRAARHLVDLYEAWERPAEAASFRAAVQSQDNL